MSTLGERLFGRKETARNDLEDSNGSQPENIFPPEYINQSVRIGSIRGIPLRVHYTFPVLWILLTFSYAPQGEAMALACILYGPVLSLTILIHELGHCAASQINGSEVHGILFWPMGGLAFVGHSSSPFDDLKVSFAGPLTHLPQLLAWMLLSAVENDGVPKLTFGDNDFWTSLCVSAFYLNLGLMVFNLLVPAYPLDGGRIFVDILLLSGCSVVNSAWACVVVSVSLAIAMGVYGLIAGLSGLTLILISMWIIYQTYNLWRHITNGTIEYHPLFNFPPPRTPGTSNPIMPSV